MMRRYAFVPAVLLALVVGGVAVSGCGPKTKPALIRADATIYQACKAISDTEVVLSRAGVLTPAQSVRINERLLPVARLGLEVTQALKAWQPGQPLPAQLPALVRELGDAARVVVDVVSSGDTRAALLEKIALAQQAVLVIVTLMGGAA